MPVTFDFATCFEVDDDVIAQALAPAHSLSDPSPREKVLALLERMSEVASPRQGATRVLVVLAKTAGCRWLEGQLEVRLRPGHEGTDLEVLIDDGLSMTRLHTPLWFDAPFLEFEQAVRGRAREIEPLVVQQASKKEIRLRVGEAAHQRQGAVASEVFTTDKSTQANPLLEEQAKKTMKLRAVNIPPEAYRDDDPRSKPNEPITTKIKAVRPEDSKSETKLHSKRPPSLLDDLDSSKKDEDIEDLELDDLDEPPELEKGVEAPPDADDEDTGDIDEGWG